MQSQELWNADTDNVKNAPLIPSIPLDNVFIDSLPSPFVYESLTTS